VIPIDIMRLLCGFIDMHIHPGPDIIARKFDVFELGRVYEDLGVGGVVIKSHYIPTVTLAWSLNSIFKKIRFYGSLTLNTSVGGLNPKAVVTSIKLGAKVIWMPTLSAENHIKAVKEFKTFNEVSGIGLRIVKNGRILDEVEEILHLIAENNVVLASGHLSVEESVILVDEARSIGVKNIIISHPEFYVVNMPIETQKELANKGAFIEYCYRSIVRSRNSVPVGIIAKYIKTVGAYNCILSTDLGSPESPYPHEGLLDFIRKLLSEGILYDELKIMLRDNPRKLLGIDSQPR